MEYLDNPHFKKELEMEENEWGIPIKVTEEWEDTCDKVLGYYNTKDLRSICEEFWCGSKSFCDKMCCGKEVSLCNKVIRLDELEKWMKPQMEPSRWKWVVGFVIARFRDEYKKEKQEFVGNFQSMMEKCETYCIDRQLSTKLRLSKVPDKLLKRERNNVKDAQISKRMIIGFIIDSLRRGEKEVTLFSLKTITFI